MTEVKKNWGSFLKSLVVEEVPESHAALPTPAAIPGQQGIPVPAALPSIDPAVRERIDSTLVDEAPQGYKLFRMNLATLAEALPSDDMIYKAVLKLLAKQGYPTDRLVLDISKCLQLLEGHRVEFSAELSRQVDQKVGGRKKTIAEKEEAITLRRAEIEKLTREIGELESARSQELELISQDTSKLDQVRANFEVAYGEVYRSVELQKKNVETYGK